MLSPRHFGLLQVVANSLPRSSENIRSSWHINRWSRRAHAAQAISHKNRGLANGGEARCKYRQRMSLTRNFSERLLNVKLPVQIVISLAHIFVQGFRLESRRS